MSIQWIIQEHDKLIHVKFTYNVYWGSKKLYIDEKEILSIKKLNFNDEISFTHSDKEYKLHLVPDGYGYTGYLVTMDGEEIHPETSNKVYNKTPLWILPFVIVNMTIPIISVEAFTPWLIGILGSYITAKFAQRPTVKTKLKAAASLAISLLAWTAYYVFYLKIKKLGINGGFVSIK